VTIWLDAQLSPALATWVRQVFLVEAVPVRDPGLRDAADAAIFESARSANAVVMTKDSDFVQLLERHGPPPQVLWLTCGNTSNEALQQVLQAAWPTITTMLTAGEPLVEIGDMPRRD
jgi:predicted nuclease of predicted toxin-antitoxin system